MKFINIFLFISIFLIILNYPTVKNINKTSSKYTNDEITFLITFSEEISTNDFNNIYFLDSSNNVTCYDIKTSNNINYICKSIFTKSGTYYLYIDSINSTISFDLQNPTLIDFTPNKINSLNKTINFSFFFEENFTNIQNISFGISNYDEINCTDTIYIENDEYSQFNCSAIFEKENLNYTIFINEINSSKTISLNNYSSLLYFFPTKIEDLDKIILFNFDFSENIQNLDDISFGINHANEIICYNPSIVKGTNNLKYICPSIFKENGRYNLYISNINTKKYINVIGNGNFFKINLILIIFIILIL